MTGRIGTEIGGRIGTGIWEKSKAHTKEQNRIWAGCLGRTTKMRLPTFGGPT